VTSGWITTVIIIAVRVMKMSYNKLVCYPQKKNYLVETEQPLYIFLGKENM